MTGYMSKHMRHRCPSDGCYLAQLPWWDEYIAAFPRNIRPTDIDGMVEINDHFLFMEEKRQEAKSEEGQRKALRRLSKRERVTIVFFRPGTKSELEVLIFDENEPEGWVPRTKVWLTDWLHDWAYRADQSPRPSTAITERRLTSLPAPTSSESLPGSAAGAPPGT